MGETLEIDDDMAPARPANRWFPALLWLHVVLVLFAVATVYYKADRARQTEVRSLAVYSPAPEFSLQDSDGTPFGSEDLRGYAWVASFATAGEDKESRLVVLRLEELQNVIANLPQAKLVTFSRFPERETPARLREYARKHRKTGQWVFLTGERAEIGRVMSAGFRLPRAPDWENPALALNPTNRLILVDRAGNIRGYYDATKIEEVRQLAQDIGQAMQ